MSDTERSELLCGKDGRPRDEICRVVCADSCPFEQFERNQRTVRVTAKMLRAGNAAVVTNRWHPLPIHILKAIYLAMEAARAKAP